jgi:transcriptional regulator with XRE-family HTH domain
VIKCAMKGIHYSEMMSESERLCKLGVMLRSLRQQRDLTLERLAEISGLSTGLLSQLERGMGNPSLNTLLNLADTLEIPVWALFHETNPSTAIIIRRSDRQRLVSGDPGVTVELLSSDLGYPVQFLWIERAPGETTEQRPSRHKGAEFGVVIQGTLEIHLNDEVHLLEQGDSISFQSDISHWYKNPGDEWLIYVCAVASPISRELNSLL